MYGEAKVALNVLLNSAPYGTELLASRLGRFISGYVTN
jgi:hypothetical protein